MYKIIKTDYNYNNHKNSVVPSIDGSNFETIESAIYFLISPSSEGGLNCSINDDGLTFSESMPNLVLHHNAYSLPDFEIVGSKSGRSNAKIRKTIADTQQK
tara:strand:- start:14 stop:316 length:303 start_codon:yes stop_codon:yes gene_type:complete